MEQACDLNALEELTEAAFRVPHVFLQTLLERLKFSFLSCSDQ